ncbi:hypothetical protein GDO81_003897 [Engystomops pustulosus]|uniref:DUF4685 domain-containing protein n=2 Tax=Engystomops pustulosus TaxID=76066 RepID=A0AAV7A4M2_ENGPU|nr:hypothetical protein GDO81_003897 [Engystomops pustulosus]
MLMDVPTNSNKTLDGFYNELRRKYPDAFALATELGRRNGSLQKLPRLERPPPPGLGIPTTTPNVASPQRWSPDSFLTKVKYQKTRNEQKKEVEIPQPSGNAVIINDQAIPVPTWTQKDYLESQNGALFHLPTLRTQIEQNKLELKNRLSTPKKETNQRSPFQANDSVQAKPSSDNTTTQTTRDYTTTRTSRDKTETTQRSPLKTSNNVQAKTSSDSTTSQTTQDYTTTRTSRDYTTTQPTKDYTTTKTPSSDYTIKKSTNDYTTIKTTKDYATNPTIKDNNTSKATKYYTTTHTQTTRGSTTTKIINDYATTESTDDNTSASNYTVTRTSNNYSTIKTIRDYTTKEIFNDYSTTKPSKDYTTADDDLFTKTSNDYTNTKSTMGYPTTRDRSPLRTNVSGVKSDPLGTIMKELLPNKPSQLMKDLPKTTNRLPTNGGFISDSDSGVSVCTPMKMFRPKIRSPQAPPASRDIKKKFSAKPKRTSEPLKADHSLVRENITSVVQVEDNPVTKYSKSSIVFNEKIPQGPPKARVHFEDESAEDAEFRYLERRLLERTQTTKISPKISPASQIKYMERHTKSEIPERSSSPSRESQKPKATDQQTMSLPHRRQPFPPNVAKKVLIDIPRGGLPSRRMPPIWFSPVMRDITNKPLSPRTSLDGITMSFTNVSHETVEKSQSITTKEDERGHHSLSSLETIESGTTEVSSEAMIQKTKWGESNSSISSGNQSRSSSQNRDLNLEHTSQNKGGEISFYSKVRRSLRLKKKPSSEATRGSRLSDDILNNSKDLQPDHGSSSSVQSDGGIHGKARPHGAADHRLPHQTGARDSIPSGNRMKKDMAEMRGVERTHSVKAPYSPMKMMQSLLRKGRAKDYLVRVPSPPPQDARPPTSSRYRRGQTPDQTSGRVLAVQPDSSRLVELERPKLGFSGLYLTKKNQPGYSGECTLTS